MNRWIRIASFCRPASLSCFARRSNTLKSKIKLRSLLVRGNLDQVAVGIAAIDRHDRAQRALLVGRAFLDRDAARLEMFDHLQRRRAGQETEIVAARRDRLPGEPFLLRR